MPINKGYNQFVTAMKCEVADTPISVVMDARESGNSHGASL
ncbi:MAG: hypothetical protein ACK5KR_00320 [Breznakia sp.]